MSDTPDDLLKQVAGMPHEDRKAFANGLLAQLPDDEKTAAVKATAATLTKPQQAEIMDELRGMVPPGDKTRDKLWLVVVVAFATVLVGSFVTIAVGMFKAPPAAAAAKPEPS